MPHSPVTALNKNDRCKLHEITEILRQTLPKTTDKQALEAALMETQATSFKEAVDHIYRASLETGSIKHTKCVAR